LHQCQQNEQPFSPEITEHKKGCDILHCKSSSCLWTCSKMWQINPVHGIQILFSWCVYRSCTSWSLVCNPQLITLQLLSSHEALSVLTHSWSHFNYSPLTSNQSMISYGLLTMIMKITHIVEERLIIFFQENYSCTYRKMNDNFLEERMCYMQCSICWTKRNMLNFNGQQYHQMQQFLTNSKTL